MKRKAGANRRKDAGRCFAVCAAADKSTVACRYKRKNGESWVAIGQQDYQPATCAGTLTVERGIRVEVWQTKSYTLESPIEEVVNVPLLPTHTCVLWCCGRSAIPALRPRWASCADCSASI